MSHQIVIQRAVPARGIPSARSLRSWAQAALGNEDGELTLRIVDSQESQALNTRYRGKSGPTNVLSFPYEDSHGVQLLGDIVICAPVVEAEARHQGKSTRSHWAHMVVHGCLHILGYDHVVDSDAITMEAREREVLAGLGFSDPYQEAGDVPRRHDV